MQPLPQLMPFPLSQPRACPRCVYRLKPLPHTSPHCLRKWPWKKDMRRPLLQPLPQLLHSPLAQLQACVPPQPSAPHPSTPVEEVAVERGDAQALAGAYPHHRLPSRRARQVVPHLMRHLGLVPRKVEAGVVVRLGVGGMGGQCVRKCARWMVYTIHMKRWPCPLLKPG